jgi:Ca-activated chloride channel family protein
MPADFHFLHPLWLLALVPLSVLLWLGHRSATSESQWRQVCDAHLLPYLLVGQSRGAARLPLWLIASGWTIAVLALANPTWDKRPQPVYQGLDARVIVLDLSRSMEAPDLSPSRLMQAKYKVTDILRRSDRGQTGLVVFAGAAFVVSPLTRDADTIVSLLSALEPALMPRQGSRADLGLRQAQELLEQAGIGQGEVLLVADGLTRSEQPVDAARALRSNGYTVSVLGIGTEQGEPLPDNRGGFVKDRMGNIVVPKLKPWELRAVAAAGGGRYATIRPDNADLRRLLAERVPRLGTKTRAAEVQTEDWRARGPLLVLLLLPVAALAFRRGWLLSLVAVVGTLSLSNPVQAWEWHDLWARRDQQAYRALSQGAYDRAAELAEEHLLRGAAAYRQGEYQRALDAFEQAEGPTANYNRGNALAKLGRLQEAIKAYDQALAKRPDMEDAQVNREAVEALLRRQQAPQSDTSSQDPGSERSPGRAHSRQPNSQRETRNGEVPMDQASRESAGERQDKAGTTPQQATARDTEHEAQQPRQDSPQSGAPQARAETRTDSGQGQADQETQLTAEEASETGEARSHETIQGRDHGRDHAHSGRRASSEPVRSEQQLAIEQWLRRIPDDPGGLLRRKFLYQYQQRADQAEAKSKPAW